MGHAAADSLRAMLADPDADPAAVLLARELVVRESCGARRH
jgi:DNA-binding LacI/PurR family transcriptional regulator